MDMVEGTHFCGHCQQLTLHRCYYSEHERDSSSDYFICMVCYWEYSGLIGEYRPPLNDPGIPLEDYDPIEYYRPDNEWDF